MDKLLVGPQFVALFGRTTVNNICIFCLWIVCFGRKGMFKFSEESVVIWGNQSSLTDLVLVPNWTTMLQQHEPRFGFQGSTYKVFWDSCSHRLLEFQDLIITSHQFENIMNMVNCLFLSALVCICLPHAIWRYLKFWKGENNFFYRKHLKLLGDARGPRGMFWTNMVHFGPPRKCLLPFWTSFHVSGLLEQNTCEEHWCIDAV